MEPPFLHLAAQNPCLRHVDQSSLAALDLSLVQFKANDTLIHCGQTIRHALFIVSGVLSTVTEFRDGRCIGSGLIGSDGVLGLDALHGKTASRLRVRALTNGLGYMCRADTLRQHVEGHADFASSLIRHSQSHLQRTISLSACNALHAVDQRVARWLLSFHRLSPDGQVPITQNLLSEELGVRRTTITLMLERLRKLGAITSKRSQIVISDHALLMEQACECVDGVGRSERYVSQSEPCNNSVEMPLGDQWSRSRDRRFQSLVQ